jgi:hypothetical protein
VKAAVGVAAPELPLVVVGVDDGCVGVAAGDDVVVLLPALAFVLFDVPLLHPVENVIAAASVIAAVTAKRILIFNLLIESQPP